MKLQRSSAYCPMRTFACGCFGPASARRGRRCPAGAHAGAVGAARRLRCGARPGVAPHNSLRSLRSLRSNRCGESDNEARCARRPQAWPCRPRRAKPGRSQGTSGPLDRLCPCSPPRRPRNRPHRAPPAATERCSRRGNPLPQQQRRVRAGRGAPGRRREAQGSWPRAQRASMTDSAPLFERSERSERSEFGDGAMRPSIAGKPAQRAGRLREAPRPARTRLCRPHAGMRRERRTSASGSKPPFNVQARFMRRGSREARWSN